jgi:hypothetical protein
MEYSKNMLILEIQSVVGNFIDPEKILSSSAILERIEAICKRHFSNENDQNESYVFILDSLKADNFKRLRAYKGKSKLTTEARHVGRSCLPSCLLAKIFL